MEGEGGATGHERHNLFGERAKALFLDALSETCHVKHSAERAGVSRTIVYRTYRRDPAFASRWMEALAQGYVRLEEKLLAHALRAIGDDSPVGEADDPIREAGEGGGFMAGKTAFTDARLAYTLLMRHHGSVAAGRKLPIRGRHVATPEDADAALRRLLDGVARKLDARS